MSGARCCGLTRPRKPGCRRSATTSTPVSPKPDREGWLGEIAGLKVTLQAAGQKLQTMRQIADRHGVTHLGMPSFRDAVGRTSA